MPKQQSQEQRILHRSVAIFVAILCALFLQTGLASTASASSQPSIIPQPVSAPQVVQAATAAGDWCGPGHDNWKSWWIPDHWGKADFSVSCLLHDRCYSTISGWDRLTCDQHLKDDMRIDCRDAYKAGVKRSACYAVASAYYKAVRKWAKANYQASGNPA